jgi:tetratricopeptide (TPR) repeat protein
MAKRRKPKNRSSKRISASKTGRQKRQASNPREWIIPPTQQRAHKIERLNARGNNRTALENWELGRLYVYEGCIEDDDKRLDDGVALLAAAATAEPPYPEAVLDLSWVMTLKGLSSVALEYAKKATELLPERRDAWAFYGRSCADRGKLDEAQRALQITCAFPDATTNDKALLSSLQAGESHISHNNVVSFFSEGVLGLHLGVFQDIEKHKYMLFLYRQILKIDPEDIKILYFAALDYYWLEQFTPALELLDRLIQLNADHADGLTLKARIYGKTERIDEAIALYRKALLADEEHVLANCNLAKHLLDAGKAREGREYVKTALEVDPEFGQALHLYGNSIAMIEKDYVEESKYHERALRVEPKKPFYHLSYCMCLLQQGDFRRLERAWRKGKRFILSIEDEQALLFAKLIPVLIDPPDSAELWDVIVGYKDNLGGSAFSRALERMLNGIPRHISDGDLLEDAYTAMGTIAGQCEQHELALRAFLKAEQIDGRGNRCTLNVAVGLNFLGRNSEALERAFEVSPETPRALTILGNLLKDANRLEEAFECYRRAVEVDVGFLLPVSNGTHIGCTLRRWSDVEKLQEALLHVEGQELACALVRAKLFNSKGMPWRVVEVLEEPLTTAWEKETSSQSSELLHDCIHGDFSADEMNEMLAREGVEGDLSEPDLTLFGGQDDLSLAFFSLAKALWECGHAGRALNVLIEGMEYRDKIQVNGNWHVLKAECLRTLDEIGLASDLVDWMMDEPPPLITAALISLAANEVEAAVEHINKAIALEVEGHVYTHPFGNTLALEDAIISMIALQTNDLDRARVHAQRAYDGDRDSAFCALALMNCLNEQSNTESALQIGSNILQSQPGDPNIIDCCLIIYMEQEQVSTATTLLKEQREFLEFRSARELASIWGERIATVRLVRLSQSINPTDADKILQLIHAGESKRIEFKETYSLDVRTQSKEKHIEDAALKTIVGFLNAIGGDLLIGVADNGEIVGIETELAKLYKDSSDKLLLHLKNRTKDRIGEQFYTLFEKRIIKVNGRQVLWVECQPSESPVWLDKTSFYVRTNPATDKLQGQAQHDYIMRHFGK